MFQLLKCQHGRCCNHGVAEWGGGQTGPPFFLGLKGKLLASGKLCLTNGLLTGMYR